MLRSKIYNMDMQKDFPSKGKLKVDLDGKPANNLNSRKNSVPCKLVSNINDVSNCNNNSNVSTSGKMANKLLKIEPKNNVSSDDASSTKNNVTMATEDVNLKSSLQSRFILPNAGILANPLTTLMTALPGVSTGSSSPVTHLLSPASSCYYLIKLKPPTENIQQVTAVSKNEPVSTSGPCNYVYAMPVNASSLNPENVLGVIPQPIPATPLILNYNVQESKKEVSKPPETKLVTPQPVFSPAVVTPECMNSQETNVVVKQEHVQEETNQITVENRVEDCAQKTQEKMEKIDDIDDSDMSLGAQLLLNLSNQNNMRLPVKEPEACNDPVPSGTEKPCVGGNSQFPFRNLIFQISKPIKCEPPDDWSESSDTSQPVSVSIKQEHPEPEIDVVGTDSQPSLNVSAGSSAQDRVQRVSTRSLPQSVTQIIEENVLSKQNIPHTVSQAQVRTASRKSNSVSVTTRNVGNKLKHTYCQTRYSESANKHLLAKTNQNEDQEVIDWEKEKKAIEAEKLKAALRMSPTQMKSKHLSMHSKKPIRPVDRQKMGPWLKNLLDNETCPGLVWVDKSHKVFQVSWRHRARMGWDMKLDGDVFERWARHTGIYCDGDPPEPRRWKTNFRAALHSMSDVEELPGIRKGRYAYRRYYFRDFEESENSGNSSSKKLKKDDKHKTSSLPPEVSEETNSQVMTGKTLTENNKSGKYVEYIRVPLPSAKTESQVDHSAPCVSVNACGHNSSSLPKNNHPNLATLLDNHRSTAVRKNPVKTNEIKSRDTSSTGTESTKEDSSDIESTSSVELSVDVMDLSQDRSKNSAKQQNQTQYIPTSQITSFNIPSQEILGNIPVAEPIIQSSTQTSATTSIKSVISNPAPILYAAVVPSNSDAVQLVQTSVAPVPMSVGLFPSSMVTVPASLGHIPSVVPKLSVASCVTSSPLPSISTPSSASVQPDPTNTSAIENKNQKTIRLVPAKRKRKKSEDAGAQEVKPFCTFCEKLVRNLSTHLDRKHRKETAVAEALSFLSYLRSKSAEAAAVATEDVADVSEDGDGKEHYK